MGRPEDYISTYKSMGASGFNISTEYENNIDASTQAEIERALQTDYKALDKQIGGTHYQLPIQPVDYITKNNLGYLEGNVIKYVTRHKSKNGVEDIKKAIHYLEMILEKEYNE